MHLCRDISQHASLPSSIRPDLFQMILIAVPLLRASPLPPSLALANLQGIVIFPIGSFRVSNQGVDKTG